MKRPAFQFYPGDWLRNANLRRCSHAARGAWMDVLCVLHDSDEYGLIRWPLADLANACAAPIRLLRELVEKGVLKGCDKGPCEPFIYTPRSGRKDGDPVTLVAEQDGPIWYSSRMVKDEHVRTIRGEGSRFGDSPEATPKRTPKSAPKPTFGDGSSSAFASATSVDSAARAPRPAKKCPQDFVVTDDMVTWARTECPGVSISAETPKFRDHTFATAATDWPGRWRNWMRKAAEMARPSERSSAAAGRPRDIFEGNTI